MPDTFLTLARPAEAETRVRGSRFLALAFPAADEDEARGVLQQRERSHFDATHHCAAWRFRAGGWRALDAGEPGGSAGPPILAAIDARDLMDVGVVVTRYFGGTKLGVGGLVRAYGAAADAALDAAPARRAVRAIRLRVRYEPARTAAVMRTLDRYSARGIEHGFAPDTGEAEVVFAVPAAVLDALCTLLRDATSGAVVPERLDETILYEG